MIRSTVLPTMLIASAYIAPATAQQRDLSQVEITSEQIGENLHVLYGAGGNMALSYGPDGAFLVDDQFAPLTPKISAKVQELAGQDVRFLINTHWHGDHTGGNENFGEAGALIVAHDNVRRRMASEQRRGEDVMPPSPPGALPVLTFSERQSFHLNGGTVRAVHVPDAHTDGDALIHFPEANVLHMGDTFFAASAGTFPFIDRNSGGSIQGMIAAVDAGLQLADGGTRVIPGHGRVTDRSELAAYRNMLSEVMQSVEAMAAAGRSREEILAARPAAAYAEGRTGGFISEDQFVGFVFDSLTAPGVHTHEDGTGHTD